MRPIFPTPGPRSKPLPFLPPDPGLPQDAHQQAAAYVLRVWIRDPKLYTAAFHVLVIATGYRRLEAQCTQASDQVPALDRTNGRHSSDFADFEAVAVNLRNRRVIGDAEEYPSLQHALQLFPASLEGPGIRPDARDRRDIAIERSVILDDFVPGLMHGCPDIRSEHGSIIISRLISTKLWSGMRVSRGATFLCPGGRASAGWQAEACPTLRDLAAADGDADQSQGQADHHNYGGPGDGVERAGIGPLTHEVVLVDEQDHENQDEWQERTVQHLRQKDHADQREAGDQDHAGAHHDEQGVEQVENGGFAHALVHAGFEAQTLAHGVSRGERKNAGGEDRGIEKAGAEKQKGILAERLEGLGGFLGVLNVARVDAIDGAGAGDDDEEGHYVGHDAANDDFEARGGVFLDRDAFFDDGRLQIELHPGGDGGSDHANEHVDVT